MPQIPLKMLISSKATFGVFEEELTNPEVTMKLPEMNDNANFHRPSWRHPSPLSQPLFRPRTRQFFNITSISNINNSLYSSSNNNNNYSTTNPSLQLILSMLVESLFWDLDRWVYQNHFHAHWLLKSQPYNKLSSEQIITYLSPSFVISSCWFICLIIKTIIFIKIIFSDSKYSKSTTTGYTCYKPGPTTGTAS